MNRRTFVTSILTALPMELYVGKALADVQCGPQLPPAGFQSCSTGIEVSQFNAVYDTQYMNEWCWAACISMVFAYYGHPVSQARIVADAWGGVVNMPGSPGQILSALNRVWRDDRNFRFKVDGDLFSANSMTASQDLSNNMPLIICSLGHAMVFTRLDYIREPNGNGAPQSAYVRDPWPGMGLRPLTSNEWNGAQMLIRIRVS